MSLRAKRHDRTWRPVVPFLHTTSDVSTFKFFDVAVRSFTADSSLLQPTGLEGEHHTSHVAFLVQLHAHAWFKSSVCRAHVMCHPHVFVLTLFD